MKAARSTWVNANRPRGRDNALFSTYKEAKRQFRKRLRLLYYALECEFFDNIERSIDNDQNLFWALINRSKSQKGRMCELIIDNKTYRKPDEICIQWSEYFTNLYSPRDNTLNDENHKIYIQNSVNTLYQQSYKQSNVKPELDGDVTTTKVKSAVKSLKLKKATGLDCIANEHLKYGCETLIYHITTLFNMIMHQEYVPNEAKRGVIITLPKSGKKQRNLRESYRGITLLPSIYKLFETVILNRIKKATKVYNLELCHPLQNAYQERLCSTITSFTLQETVNHYIERGSKVFCAMLDASSAFDVVWHDGLFYKLFKIGINGKLWRVLRSAYQDVKSCVLYEGILSPWFNVQQSVRQGGVLSAWFYVIYMNDLPKQLQNANVGATISNKFYGCPMQADDVALLALTKHDLEAMMKICYVYSCRWRYSLNPQKTVILVFGESATKQKKLSDSRCWRLGEKPVKEHPSHRHVGITLSSTFNNTDRILIATQKIRKSFFSLIGAGLHPSRVNPSTIIKSICLPRGLFGCELWSHMNNTETNMLETTMRFCVKYMQNFPKRTKTDMALPSIGITDITTHIDKHKLLFLL